MDREQGDTAVDADHILKQTVIVSDGGARKLDGPNEVTIGHGPLELDRGLDDIGPTAKRDSGELPFGIHEVRRPQPPAVTSITTIIDRSKDPAVFLERVEKFLTLYPVHEGKPNADFACVFDIDETLLYNLENEEIGLHPFGHRLYQFCKERGFQIVLVTARVGDPAGLVYLRCQLRALGYSGYHSISMVNKHHENDASPAACKLQSRLDIGKPVILNIGNRICDLFLTRKVDDPRLARTNPQTYYAFKGQHPDILCVKVPTN